MALTLTVEFWDCFWEGDFPRNGKRRFQEYYDEMRELVPPERLLEYRVSVGWKPLCDFLEVSIPQTPFPHTNDTANFVNRCQKRNKMQMLNGLFRMLVQIVMAIMLCYLGRRDGSIATSACGVADLRRITDSLPLCASFALRLYISSNERASLTLGRQSVQIVDTYHPLKLRISAVQPITVKRGLSDRWILVFVN